MSVPKGTPGLSMLHKLDKLGCRASHAGEIVLERCRVPGAHLLGGIDRLQERIARGRETEKGHTPVVPAEEGGPAAAVQRRSTARWVPSSEPAPWSRPRRSGSSAPHWSSLATQPLDQRVTHPQ